MTAYIAILFYRTISLMPLRAIHGLGSILGWLQYVFKTDNRRISEINITLCFPELDEARRRELVRQSLAESSSAFLEMGAFWHMSPTRMERYVQSVNGKEILVSSARAKNGLIMLVPHLGLWEFYTFYAPRFAPFTAFYRPLRLPRLHEYVLAGRQRVGATLVPTTPVGIRALYKALGRGEFIAILPDQDPQSEARVFAPFFGHPAASMTLVSRLARKTGAPVVTAWAERLPRGRGFNLHITRVSDDIYSHDDLAAATALNRALEECIRHRPDQYMWSYKRFKARPDGERVDIYRKK